MNPQLTEIVYILDRSGSMTDLREQAIAGFNRFLVDQAVQPGEARLTLVLFDNEILVPVESRSLSDVPRLDAATYVPRASTALLDAIGSTVDRLGKRLAATPELDRPGQVIIAIFTDGLENASTQYSWADIAGRIQHQQEKYSWQFLFLGADQDAIATAARLNIDRSNAATIQSCKDSYARSSPDSLSRKIRAMRRAAAGTPAEPDLARPLQSIVSEEEARADGS